MSAADAASTELPSSETATYKKLCKAYDDHDYRKGIQLADQILAKAPNCSEAIAMKGLCVHGDKQKAEALKIIKDGINGNMKSGALWHALGVYYRNENDFKEAHKCFKVAFKWDGDRNSHTIVRDVSAMAIQMRDWETYGDVRQKVLSKKPNVRSNWITHATAQHMLGNVELAYGIIDVMGQVVGWGDSNIENGEVHFYRAELALLSKKPNLAVEILTQTPEKEMPDQVVRVTLLARAYAAMGNKKKAEEKYTELYSMGLSERDVLFDIAGLRGIHVQPIVKGAPAVTANEAFVALLDQFRSKFPRSDAPRRVALDFCPIEQFEARLREYCVPLISKMVPSLTSVLKTLYSNAERVAVVERVFLEWEGQLMRGESHPFGDSGLPKGRPNPLWLVWVLQFLSSHYLRLNNYAKAHEYIDRAILHTGTIEMLHIHRAKIYLREGKTTEAAYHADIGRKLDLQDKYVNGKAAKYYLRCGNIEAADKLLSYFHKVSDVDEAWLNMFDMQCAWYEIELGGAYMIRGDVLSALQAYKMVEKNLKDNHDELLDYHAYTLRRSNIRSWLDVIQNDDAATSSRFYLRAAPHIVRAYLKVHELGEEAVRAKHVPRPDVAALTKEADDKKRLEKLIKDNTLTVDLSKPLDDLQPYLTALQTSASHVMETHELSVQVALLQNRPLLALKAIRAATKLPQSATAVAALTAQLAAWRKTHEVPPPVAAVLDA